MANNRFEITGEISPYAFGANYFKYMLGNCDKGPVTVGVNSFGGDVNEALNICNQIAEHGNITVEYISYNASAATLFGLYAAHSCINSESLYLIHKAMIWIDTWGNMNEDDIEIAINELQLQKKDAEISTLTLAKCFSEKSGKPISEILEMMKNASWMTAQEVVDAGFVDEVVESKCKKKTTVSNSVAAMFAANGVPLPDSVTKTDDPVKESLTSFLEDMIKKYVNFYNKPTMDKQFSFLNKVANVEGFDVKNETVSVSVAHLTAFNDALKKASNEKSELEADKNNIISERDTAVNSLQSIINSLDSIDDTIKNAADNTAKLTALKNLIEKRPGTLATTNQGKDTHNGANLGDIVLDPVNEYFDE